MDTKVKKRGLRARAGGGINEAGKAQQVGEEGESAKRTTVRWREGSRMRPRRVSASVIGKMGVQDKENYGADGDELGSENGMQPPDDVEGATASKKRRRESSRMMDTHVKKRGLRARAGGGINEAGKTQQVAPDGESAKETTVRWREGSRMRSRRASASVIGKMGVQDKENYGADEAESGSENGMQPPDDVEGATASKGKRWRESSRMRPRRASGVRRLRPQEKENYDADGAEVGGEEGVQEMQGLDDGEAGSSQGDCSSSSSSSSGCGSTGWACLSGRRKRSLAGYGVGSSPPFRGLDSTPPGAAWSLDVPSSQDGEEGREAEEGEGESTGRRRRRGRRSAREKGMVVPVVRPAKRSQRLNQVAGQMERVEQQMHGGEEEEEEEEGEEEQEEEEGGRGQQATAAKSVAPTRRRRARASAVEDTPSANEQIDHSSGEGDGDGDGDSSEEESQEGEKGSVTASTKGSRRRRQAPAPKKGKGKGKGNGKGPRAGQKLARGTVGMEAALPVLSADEEKSLARDKAFYLSTIDGEQLVID